MGIPWHKGHQKWQAQIKMSGICKFLGYFDDKIEAAKTYDKAARKLHGKYATLNFPRDGEQGVR